MSLLKASDVNLEAGEDLYLDAKWGLDGSGSHQVRQQTSKTKNVEKHDGAVTNYVASFYCPLQFKVLLLELTWFTDKMCHKKLVKIYSSKFT